MVSYYKIAQLKIKFTLSRSWLMVIFAYTISIALLLFPTLGYWARIPYFRGAGLCMIDFSPSITTNKAIFLFGIIFPLLLSTTIIVALCYYQIYKIIHKSNKIICNYNAENHPLSNLFRHRNKNIRGFSRYDVKLAKTLGVIFSLFVLSYAPYALANMFYFFGWVRITLTQGLYLLIISCSNSVFNPIILYSRRRKRIQKSKIKVVKQVKGSSNPLTVSTNNLKL
ncbi:Rhodopsin, GQ-coupled [Trichoplax sp. H2]|nr:Rhodopsin, GQ-coupled [Trichoplax sp. H2]|eukprot:RDD42461.1 Rhodopsin, GQ-coupled [Trichoplax sp. H2]